MNILSILTYIYTGLANKPYLPLVMKCARVLVRKCTEVHILKYKNCKFVPWGKTEKGLIVSFTSFPARINDVWKVVVSLKNQTVLPEKIILWLSKDQFPAESSIPQSLWNQVDDLFEIQMVDGDIRSHKKHHYSLLLYPEKSFITCDDDVIYDSEMIERLVECSRKNPNCITANRTWKIQFSADGNAVHYNDWGPAGDPCEKKDLMQVGIGGVLYPPHCLHELVTRKDLFMTLIPMADDIWLNCMARLNNTPVVQTKRNVVSLPIKNDSPSLFTENNGQGKNQIQLQELRNYLRENGLKDVYFNQ